jgi:predicted CopG family antitoxin
VSKLALQKSLDTVGAGGVGAALKGNKPISDSIPVRKRKRRQLSWRERLNDLGNNLNEEERESSVTDTMSSDGSEYSDWSGIAEDYSAIYTTDKLSQDKSDASAEPSELSDEADETKSKTRGSFSDVIEEAENLRRRANEFKVWAREQSGLSDSVSNISSLPQLAPQERQAIVASLKKDEELSLRAPTDVEAHAVNDGPQRN